MELTMTTITINTHKAFKILVDSGVPENQAEGHIKVLEKIDISGVATKDDIEEIKEKIIENKADLYKFILINNIGLAGLIVALIKLL